MSPGVIVGLAFIIAGFAFKISAVPFHMWVPDVYEGAPTPVATFVAVAPKLAASALFVRVLIEPFGPLAGEWRQIIFFLSVRLDHFWLGCGDRATQHQTARRPIVRFSGMSATR